MCLFGVSSLSPIIAGSSIRFRKSVGKIHFLFSLIFDSEIHLVWLEIHCFYFFSKRSIYFILLLKCFVFVKKTCFCAHLLKALLVFILLKRNAFCCFFFVSLLWVWPGVDGGFVLGFVGWRVWIGPRECGGTGVWTMWSGVWRSDG